MKLWSELMGKYLKKWRQGKVQCPWNITLAFELCPFLMLLWFLKLKINKDRWSRFCYKHMAHELYPVPVRNVTMSFFFGRGIIWDYKRKTRRLKDKCQREAQCLRTIALPYLNVWVMSPLVIFPLWRVMMFTHLYNLETTKE